MTASGWLLGWITFFFLLYVFSKSRAGHSIIYYGAWLLVVLLLVTHATQLVKNFGGINGTGA